jgi:hypothetical protein
MNYVKKRVIILLIFSSLLTFNGYSQLSDSVQVQKKAALVIGNGAYLSSMLTNPENDARAISGVLKKIGFEVSEYENLNQSQMKKAIDDFGMKLKNYDVGLFFYAGHGIQSKGYNYLIPVDAYLQSETQVEYDCVQADRILGYMEESGAKVKIMILDACRNNPFERSWTRAASGKGLATMNAPIGTIIGYATAPGSTASDGSGKNGLYTSALLESIIIPGISISQMFQNVGRIVSQKSEKQQIPWISSSLTADFYFNNQGMPNPVIQDNVPSMDQNRNDGNEKKFSKADYPKINGPEDWQLVKVTENKDDIAGLTEVNKVKATSFWGGALWTQKGLDNCMTDLKKKAAGTGCPVVLITNKKTGGVTSVEGIAYK